MRRHHPHFADEETEGQRACPTGSHCRCFRPLSRSAIASLRVVGRLWVQTPDTAAVTRPVRHQHCPRVTSPLLSSRYVTSTRCQTMTCQREWSEEANTCNSASTAADSGFLCFAYPLPTASHSCPSSVPGTFVAFA